MIIDIKYYFIIIVTLLLSCKKEIPFNYKETGIASYYHPSLKGRKMANGIPYHPDSLTAAHKFLPFGTIVKIVDVKTKKSVYATITDRGPFIKKRIIDLSKRTADSLGILKKGISNVQIYTFLPDHLLEKHLNLSTSSTSNTDDN